jgi:Ca-activated chloride channel homolog
LVLIACLCLAGRPAAQHTFRSGTDGVLVDVLVTDGRVPIGGLTAADFELRDNGVPQRVSSVTMEEMPLSLMIAADTSASMAGERLHQLKDAARSAISALKMQDRAALVSFSQRVRLLADWTSDRAEVARAIEGVTAAGGTAMNHALEFALGYRDRAQTRALALVFSDGMDSASVVGRAALLELGDRSDVVLYGVSLSDPRDLRAVAPDHSAGIELLPPSNGPTLLDAITGATGGRLFRAKGGAELKDAFLKVVQEFRSRYVLSYSPQSVAAGGWHRVNVSLKHRRGVVTARRGYMR